MILKLKRTPAIYLVGFMGSGKSTVGRALAGELGWTFVDLDGEIMKVYDPAVHRKVAVAGEPQGVASVRRNRVDTRWVACHRPMVITGGELTIEMLDLQFNPAART